ncbi:2-dehydro-3-deoxygalactonokinase [Psychromarinibacter sp. C21-152]|uniref:2-dehydro-3-deoxygalactonokinase n=1 Tax=Psychromarinibacter sediminicola TaxID=3033385 RepID=A0AAE3NX18_9RHOB|nr:2-dehydro-3-deoxygalactonokinase [Psychromarinibacter sediminicola]MDF0602520.1 2-dehydro-3-deoxygalactonokinase [Psychromarinibacter sediminicola]
MTADWIAVDWGTTHLRAWAMTGAEIAASAESDDGMSRLAPDEFEPALLRLVGDWLGEGATRVTACGMVGARQGWAEAPYRPVPCTAAGGGTLPVLTHDARLDVRIIPGLSQDSPADVMRGEETQIAGFVAANPKFDGILCLPGTHTKWAHVSAEEVVSFRTFMTGEIFALLSSQSVLRHSLAAEDWDADAFADAVGEGLSRPESFAARAFSLRAEHLLHDQSATVSRSRLSGWLIGAELAAARPYWLGQPVALIGAPALCHLYAAALKSQGLEAPIADGDAMTLAGLAAVQLGRV